MEEKFKNLERRVEKVEGLKDMVHDIHRAIVGNEPMGHTGIVKRVQALEESDLKRKVKTAKVATFGAGAGTGLYAFIEWLIKGL